MIWGCMNFFQNPSFLAFSFSTSLVWVDLSVYSVVKAWAGTHIVADFLSILNCS